jgi:phosphoribosyl-ATP pyrophosphohydrolase
MLWRRPERLSFQQVVTEIAQKLRGRRIPVIVREGNSRIIRRMKDNARMTDSLNRLFAGIREARNRSPSASRTSKLFRDGVQKMAKKLAEEAVEVGLDAVQMNRESVILESADMLYHLAVIWVACGVTPEEVTGEIDRRERLYGIAEKLPKHAGATQRRRITPLAPRRKAS